MAWAVATLPNLTVRSFIWEEGHNAELARNLLAGGSLFDPTVYGQHWVDKPPLLPALIALLAWPTGRVDEWSARLPAMLAVLVTAMLVHAMVRRHAGRPASLFAAAGFLFCPLLLRKLTIAEPDTVVTALSFAALILWWRGVEHGHVGALRWLGCGVLLAGLAMGKGPQPVAYFALGVASYVASERRWRAVPGLALCLSLPVLASVGWAAAVFRPGDLSIWQGEMRLRVPPAVSIYLADRAKFAVGLLLDLLPMTLLLPAVVRMRDERTPDGLPLMATLIAYAGLATLAILVWPGARDRYAMPAAPALAVAAGLAFERGRGARPLLVRAAVQLTTLFMAYQVILVLVVMPLFRDRFGGTRRAGEALGRAVAEAGAPAITTGLFSNEIFYGSFPVRKVGESDPAELPVPATLLTTRDVLARFAAARPDLTFAVLVETGAGPELLAARIERPPRGSSTAGRNAAADAPGIP